MLSHRERLLGLGFCAVSALIGLAAGVFGGMQYFVVASGNAHSEAPGLIFGVCVFVVVATLPSFAGWLMVWKGKRIGYRVLSIFYGILCLLFGFAILHSLAFVFLPVALICERRFRSLRREGAGPTQPD